MHKLHSRLLLVCTLFWNDFKNFFLMQSIDLVDDEPEMILIKEEAFEDCQGESNLHNVPRNDKSRFMNHILHCYLWMCW